MMRAGPFGGAAVVTLFCAGNLSIRAMFGPSPLCCESQLGRTIEPPES